MIASNPSILKPFVRRCSLLAHLELQDYGVENHDKIGKALSSLMQTDCPYVHSKYVNEGRFPQWVYFVVQEEVEALPPLKEFFGPPLATLAGDS